MWQITFLSFAAVKIGFNPVTYSELEEAGSVNVTVSILNGTLGRNLVVTVSTTSGGTTTGEFYTHALISMLRREACASVHSY